MTFSLCNLYTIMMLDELQRLIFGLKPFSNNWNEELWCKSGFPESSEEALNFFDNIANPLFNILPCKMAQPPTEVQLWYQARYLQGTKDIKKARKTLEAFPEQNQCWIIGAIVKYFLLSNSEEVIFGRAFRNIKNKYSFVNDFVKFYSIICNYYTSPLQNWMFNGFATKEAESYLEPLIKKYPELIKKCSYKAWTNPNIIRIISKHDPSMLEEAPPVFKNHRNLNFEAIKANAEAIKYIHTKHTKDPEFLILAIQHNKKFVRYIPFLSKTKLAKLDIFQRARLKKLEENINESL